MCLHGELPHHDTVTAHISAAMSLHQVFDCACISEQCCEHCPERRTLGFDQVAPLSEELCIIRSPPQAQCMPPSPTHQHFRLDTAWNRCTSPPCTCITTCSGAAQMSLSAQQLTSCTISHVLQAKLQAQCKLRKLATSATQAAPHRVPDERTSVCSTGPQAGRLSGAGTRLSWPPHDAPPSSETAQCMPCPSLPSQKFSEPCTSPYMWWSSHDLCLKVHRQERPVCICTG